MIPSKYSPQIELPPIRSGFVDVMIVPAAVSDETCTPLTYSLNCAPS